MDKKEIDKTMEGIKELDTNLQEEYSKDSIAYQKIEKKKIKLINELIIEVLKIEKIKRTE